MNHSKLTAPPGGVTDAPMQSRRTCDRARWRFGWAIAPIAMLGGCINLTAPDQPIVIELNINIRQEVIYMLADEAAETIEQNADIF
jgi:hypothetical protein